MNTLRLSDAIRLGSLLKPQAFGFYHLDGGSCALGAAKDAIGQEDDENELKAWPIIKRINRMDCPECGAVDSFKRGGLIPHLNDDHRISREAIADIVATLEALQPAEQAVEREVPCVI